MKKQQIILSEELGTVEITLPEELDSFMSWTNYSDCRCCHEAMYRYAGRTYSIHKESGYFDPWRPDSIYQLTISHVPDFSCDSGMRHDYEGLLKAMKYEKQKELPGLIFNEAAVCEVHGRLYSVLSYSRETISVLEAITFISGVKLKIRMEILGSKRKALSKEFWKSFNTLKITANKKHDNY